MNEVLNKAIELAELAQKKPFKNHHKSDWHYKVAEDTLDVDGQPIHKEYEFLKVGAYGDDDVAFFRKDDGKIECNYAEPGRDFDSLEEAYMFHNELWFQLEKTDDEELENG